MCGSEVELPAFDGSHPTLEQLPGGWLDLHMAPPPRWPLTHRNAQLVHGIVTGLLGEGHHPTTPRFSLAPWPVGIGWAAYVLNRDVALHAAGRVHRSRLGRRPVMVRCSGLRTVSAPRISPWRAATVVVDTMTPVVIRNGSRVHGRVAASNLLSTLASWLPRLIGYTSPTNMLALELLSAETRLEHVPLGGHVGKVTRNGKRGVCGFSGRLVMRCCPTTRWLLRVAEVLGLGGRVGFGFGRIVVREVL